MLTKGLTLVFPRTLSSSLTWPQSESTSHKHLLQCIKAWKKADGWRVRGCLRWSETRGNAKCYSTTARKWNRLLPHLKLCINIIVTSAVSRFQSVRDSVNETTWQNQQSELCMCCCNTLATATVRKSGICDASSNTFLISCHHHQQCLLWSEFGCFQAWEDQTAQGCAHAGPLLISTS